MNKLLKYSVISAVFVVVVGVVFLLVTRPRGDGNNGPPPEVPVNVVTAALAPRGMPDAVLLPALVEPLKSVKVSAEVGGVVEWIGPQEGAGVAAGDVLAKVDTRTLKAELDRVSAGYELAVSNFKRSEKLHAENAVSDDEYDRRKAEVEVSKAALETVRIIFEKGTIAAPSAGILNRLHVELGEYVKPGDPVADIVQVDRVLVVTDVPEKDISYVSVGTPMAVLMPKRPAGAPADPPLPANLASLAAGILPEGTELALGTVTYRSVVADAGTLTYRVEVTVPNRDLAILPGMILRTVLLRRIVPDAIAVPLESVVPREGRAVVFVEREGRAIEVEVRLGITDGRYIQITEGLEAGDNLVIEGQRQLRNGQAVAVRESVR